MPVSRTGSVASVGSRNSAFSKRYRTKSKASTVDESLFAKPKSAGAAPSPVAAPEEVVQELMGLPQRKKKPETIQLITKDLIRRCRVRQDDPSGLTVVLAKGHFDRIQESSRVKTRAEFERMLEEQTAAKLKALEESEKRKEEMRERENKRMANTKLNDLEEEAKEKAEYLLAFANSRRMEEEDEIKKMNEHLLNAKCHAIRDAQLLEKQEMAKEEETEKMRLDMMMECDRISAIKAAEDIAEMKKKQRYIAGKQLVDQIERNATEKIINEEMKDQETKKVLQKLEELHAQDAAEIEHQRQAKIKLKKEIFAVIAAQQKERDRILEQDKLAEFKSQKYIQEQYDKQDKIEQEKMEKRKAKEADEWRLFNLRMAALDSAAGRDALKARRDQEEAERGWRRKAKEEALKRAKMNAEMIQGRREQIQNKEHNMAVQARRERDDFERVLQDQKRQLSADKERELALRDARYRNGKIVRQQIRDKEQLQIKSRKDHFAEGIRMEEEARIRRLKLQELKNKKLVELRENGIPLKYCNDIERKIHKPAKLQPAL